MARLYYPTPNFQKDANIKSLNKYRSLKKQADENAENFWDSLAQEKIQWIRKYDRVLNTNQAPFYSWFEGGKLNIADQCIDRHIDKNGDKTAIIWESESGETRKISYADLLISVNKFSNILRQDFGIKKGDRIAIYMPMIPEAIFAMLACARIGAVHVVVFGGYSSEVLKERIENTSAKLVITSDGAYRHGKPYMLKPIVDEAINKIETNFKPKVLLIKHNMQKASMTKGRDYDYNLLLKTKTANIKSEEMDSEDVLFILHTSGSTGKPKGITHTTAGYILWAQYTTEIVFDIKNDDIFWCTADIGWITGHTYGIYGPLANGTTIVMYEGTPTFPNSGRWWNIIEKHRVTKFYTAPTAIRSLRKAGPKEPMKYDLSSLKVLGSVGEPIDPSTWKWYHKTVGNNHCPIVDTWWQTETGGHMISPIPGATPTKPGSATLPLPGIHAEVLNAKGSPAKQYEPGYLCITKPCPSMFRSVWQDKKRYIEGYFNIIKSPNSKDYFYFSGDGAFYDKNGYITITGRMDDVMNVSGHRISSSEIESAIASHAKVAEIAVVGRPDEISGESIVAFVVAIDHESINKPDFLAEINEILAKDIGAIIKARTLVIVPELPKTRSGKVLRRVLRSIACNEQLSQDLSTAENSTIIKTIQDIYASEKHLF